LVFVSHCSLDTWVAKQIAREIEARGATPFLDEAHVDAGADFEEDILDFLGRARKCESQQRAENKEECLRRSDSHGLASRLEL